jgi:(E)-4-hydroxy-3-methyl-but-2-enyl pyrophosphate reductase
MNRERLYSFLLRLLTPLGKALFRVSYSGAENIPGSGGFIVCSNHRSVFDPFLLAIPFRRQIRYMAKSELFSDHGRAARTFLYAMGAFPVRRNTADRRSVRTAEQILKSGGIVGIFPQGGCVFDNSPFRPKPGVALLAARTGAPVLPCGDLLQRPGASVPPCCHTSRFRYRRFQAAVSRYVCFRDARSVGTDRGTDQCNAGGKTVKISVASSAGFCFGVNRAVNMVSKLLDEGRKVCTLGPIIHNPQTLAELSARGATIAESVGEAPRDSTLVIRSHGVGRGIYDEIAARGLSFCDATCPFVAKIHSIVAKASREGRTVLVAGDALHPEVRGILGHCAGPYYVFKNAADLAQITEKNSFLKTGPVCVAAQTTFSVTEWENCLEIIRKVYTNAVIFDTICNVTAIRQSEAAELSRTCDAMIVIGGRQSSNTAKLFDVCRSNCVTYLVEAVDELPLAALKKAERVGITAGASTPARIIKEVLDTMSEVNEGADQATTEAAAKNTKENPAEGNFEEMLEESLKTLNTDEKVHGVVVGVTPTEVLVDVGRKQAGYVPASELSADPRSKAGRRCQSRRRDGSPHYAHQ